MNRFDDEDKIISQFQEVNDNEVMFATQSETIEAVYSSIHTEALWKNWINSSGKSDWRAARRRWSARARRSRARSGAG